MALDAFFFYIMVEDTRCCYADIIAIEGKERKRANKEAEFYGESKGWASERT